MKKLRHILVTVFMAAGTVAFAQFTNSGSSSSDVSKGWNSVYLDLHYSGSTWSYPSWMDADDIVDTDELIRKYDMSESLKGFAIGYNRAFNIVRNVPLYLEVGGRLNMSFYSTEANDKFDKDEYYRHDHWDPMERDLSGTFISLKVPVSVLYHFNLGSSDFGIEPFAGFSIQYNISATYKAEGTEYYLDYDSDTDNEIWVKDYTEKKDGSLFDEDDMGDVKTANRLQFGSHSGVNFVYKNKYYAGLKFDVDLNKFQDDTSLRFHTFSLNLGYRF